MPKSPVRASKLADDMRWFLFPTSVTYDFRPCASPIAGVGRRATHAVPIVPSRRPQAEEVGGHTVRCKFYTSRRVNQCGCPRDKVWAWALPPAPVKPGCRLAPAPNCVRIVPAAASGRSVPRLHTTLQRRSMRVIVTDSGSFPHPWLLPSPVTQKRTPTLSTPEPAFLTTSNSSHQVACRHWQVPRVCFSQWRAARIPKLETG